VFTRTGARSGFAAVGVVVIGLLWSASAKAQSVRGRILDAETGQGIPSVKVTLLQGDNRKKIAEVLTNSRGAFALGAVATGPHRLQTSHIGYASVTTDPFAINNDEQVVVDVKVSVSAVALDPLTIVARRRDPAHEATEEGMYARRLTLPPLGLRRVMLPFDPEMQGAIDVNDVIRSNFPQTSRRPCTVVYWNGQLVADTAMANQWMETSVSELEAVEFYRNAIDAPMAFREIPVQISFENRECQIVALWPRTGRYQLEDPPIPLPAALRLWRGYVNATAYHLSGDHAPGTGIGLELSTHNQVYHAIGLGLHLRMTRHTLPADATAAMSVNLSPINYEMPVGERPMLLYMFGVEPRLTAFESDKIQILVGARLQGGGRTFSLIRNDAENSEEKHTSYGWGFGGSANLEYQASEKLALNAGLGLDRLSFGTFKFLEGDQTRTASTWTGAAFRFGIAYFLNR
jgi:hypothetical protein